MSDVMLTAAPKREQHRDLLGQLRDAGLTEYGSAIPSVVVHEALGIVHPHIASKATYDRLAVIELAAIDYCRNALLNEGKYLQGTPTGYRVLLPSENRGQIDAYMGSADRKLARALKLSRNTPSESIAYKQDEVRILMKQSGRRHYSGHQQHLGH